MRLFELLREKLGYETAMLDATPEASKNKAAALAPLVLEPTDACAAAIALARRKAILRKTPPHRKQVERPALTASTCSYRRLPFFLRSCWRRACRTSRETPAWPCPPRDSLGPILIGWIVDYDHRYDAHAVVRQAFDAVDAFLVKLGGVLAALAGEGGSAFRQHVLDRLGVVALVDRDELHGVARAIFTSAGSNTIMPSVSLFSSLTSTSAAFAAPAISKVAVVLLTRTVFMNTRAEADSVATSTGRMGWWRYCATRGNGAASI
jgi:hypothetical protein